MPITLQILGCIYIIIGFIAGVRIIEYSTQYGLLIIFFSLVQGLSFAAIGMGLDYLQQIKKHLGIKEQMDADGVICSNCQSIINFDEKKIINNTIECSICHSINPINLEN